MAYTLHIERNPTISLEEWREAISSIEGVKIDNSDFEVVNPKTGEVISMGTSKGGDVAILFESKGFLGFGKNQTWEKCISFENGKGSFNAKGDIESSSNLLHRAAAEIAAKLAAKIIGDEGEEYKW